MANGAGAQSLLETVLRSIFVELCDWKTTSTNIFNEASNYLSYDPSASFRVLCVGPGTRSLIRTAPTHERLCVLDKPVNLIDDEIEDKIAIVGLSLNYPGANDQEKLWAMLKEAQSTASKVSWAGSSSACASNQFNDWLDLRSRHHGLTHQETWMLDLEISSKTHSNSILDSLISLLARRDQWIHSNAFYSKQHSKP